MVGIIHVCLSGRLILIRLNVTCTFERSCLRLFDLKLSHVKITGIDRSYKSRSNQCSFSNRRFIWNFFRLENEHLNNCGKFRAVRDISVAPVDCSDQTHILRMMDAVDGVVNRKRKQKFADKSKSPRVFSKGESLICDLNT